MRELPSDAAVYRYKLAIARGMLAVNAADHGISDAVMAEGIEAARRGEVADFAAEVSGLPELLADMADLLDAAGA